MGHLKNLVDLLNAKVCDEDTLDILNINSPVVHKVVDDIHEAYSTYDKLPNPIRMKLGTTLLFLEEIVQANAHEQIGEWLEDEKRMFLYDNSEQAELYLRLLFAKTKGKLEVLRAKYNSKVRSQPKFEYEETFTVSYEHKEEELEERKKLIEEKLEAILEKIKDGIIDTIGLGDFENKTRLRELTKKHYEKEIATIQEDDTYYDGASISLDDCSLPRRIFDLAHQLEESDFYEIKLGLDRIGRSFRGYSEYLGIVEDNVKLLKKYLAAVREEINPIIDELENNVFDADFDTIEEITNRLLSKLEKFEWVEGYSFDQNDIHELRILSEENLSIERQIPEMEKLSGKLKKSKTLTYSFELSEKDPLDVKFGNDSGCCVGVYPKTKDISNGYCLPHFMADNATYIFNIKQQFGNGKKRRVGIVLAFETYDKQGNKVLACNSIEMSPSMNPYDVIKPVVALAEEALGKFAEENGFQAVFMSNHGYNTSYNYTSKKEEKPEKDEVLRKKTTQNRFYSEIFNNNSNRIQVNSNNFYVICDNR